MKPQPAGSEWWRSAVVYQIYPRSFADSDGDGVGDINGIRSKLPYLARLGVDAIWISPYYTSPLFDGGYDVADYRSIDERLGTMDDVDALIALCRTHRPTHAAIADEQGYAALRDGLRAEMKKYLEK